VALDEPPSGDAAIGLAEQPATNGSVSSLWRFPAAKESPRTARSAGAVPALDAVDMISPLRREPIGDAAFPLPLAITAGTTADPDNDAATPRCRLVRVAPPAVGAAHGAYLRLRHRGASAGRGRKETPQTMLHPALAWHPELSPFRKPPPPLAPQLREEHRPVLTKVDPLLGSAVPGVAFASTGEAAGAAAGGSVRRASEVSSMGAMSALRAEEATSPTRRNGKVAFLEGQVGYILDATSTILLTFNPMDAPRDAEIGVGAIVSFRRTHLEDARVVATHLGPALPEPPSPNPDLFASGVQNSSNGFLKALSSSLQHDASGSRDDDGMSAATTNNSRRPSVGDTMRRGPSPPTSRNLAASTTAGSLTFALAGAATAGDPEEDDLVGTVGWEFHRLVQRQRGEDPLLCATPNTLVRLVDASCHFDRELAAQRVEEERAAERARQRKRDPLDRAAGSGPLMASHANAWARRHHPVAVMQAAASVLNAKPLRREDGEHLLFDDLPQRLRPDDIEAWEEDPGQRRRQRMNDGMAVAKETYSSWYVKPEDRYTAFLTEAAERKQQHAVTRKKPERPTTAQRPSMPAVPTPSPPRVLLLQSGTTPCDAGLSSGSAGSPSLDHRVVAAAVTRGEPVGVEVLTKHIAKIQAGDRKATHAMVEGGLRLQRANAFTAAEVARATLRGDEHHGGPTNAPSAGGPEPLALRSPADNQLMFDRNRLTSAGGGGDGQDGSGAAGVYISRKHRLPRQQYHGKLWALSQGDALTAKNAPNEAEAERALSDFVAIGLKKPSAWQSQSQSMPIIVEPM
jgi:hypothetical protein